VETEQQEQPRPSFVPAPILKAKGAINLYYAAVGALPLVVLALPIISIWATFRDVVWNGWLLSIGGLISLLGAQSVQQEVSRNA